MTDANTKSVVTRARKRAARTGRKVLYKLTTRPSTRRADLVGKPERWETQRRFQFEFLTSHGLRPEHRLLDIGCGTLRGGIPLIEYLDTGHYAGIEARAAVLKEGRKELADSGLEYKSPLLIHAADPADIQLDAPIDFAWAFMALIHMPDEIVDAYLALVSRSLTEGGQFYGNVKFGDHPEGSWQGFPVVSRPREFYERLATSHGLLVRDLGTLESLGHRVGSIGDQYVMLRFTRASN
jgi:cyclopropane fatty-acyl-phospholipid synthase-like methyltransferase